jgi:hypothetical protein
MLTWLCEASAETSKGSALPLGLGVSSSRLCGSIRGLEEVFVLSKDVQMADGRACHSEKVKGLAQTHSDWTQA